ncbi:MAG: hypothetical protein QE487_16675 [Fluviicola sp.]|nr:hypothetical protein [Fluviicola sp.]
MDNENIKLIIAIWGAVLSTILAIIKIFQDRNESKIKLFIDCQEKKIENETFLVAFIANIWKRPVTIVEVNLGLGNFDNQRIVYSKSLNPMLKLQESEPEILAIEKKEILKFNENLSDDDFMFSRLIINVKLSSGKTISELVNLDVKNLKATMLPKYDEFLLASDFFNRNIVHRYNEIWTRNMKYQRK